MQKATLSHHLSQHRWRIVCFPANQDFLKLMKEAHDRYGMKVQLNCFYRLDFFYGTDEFTLGDVTDAYKAEFEAASDWLKLLLSESSEPRVAITMVLAMSA